MDIWLPPRVNPNYATACPHTGSQSCAVGRSLRTPTSVHKGVSGERGNGTDDIGREEEKIRNGLKRNIAQLSNLTRVNKEELARLREQVGVLHTVD